MAMIALREQIEISPRLSARQLRLQQRLTAAPAANRSARTVDPNGIITALATSQREVHAALGLVYDAYIETNLITPNPFGMRVTNYHLLSTTHIFTARKQGELQGTLTLVRDSAAGLPMENVYRDEVEARRARGLTVAEVSCLADSGHGKTNMLSVVVQLMSHMAQFARRQGVDELLVAVHPHHVGFYERFIGFEIIGEQKTYAAVCDKPAVALALDLNGMPVNHPRAYQRFFGTPFSDFELTPRKLSSSTLAILAKIVRETQLQAPVETEPVPAAA